MHTHDGVRRDRYWLKTHFLAIQLGGLAATMMHGAAVPPPPPPPMPPGAAMPPPPGAAYVAALPGAGVPPVFNMQTWAAELELGLETESASGSVFLVTFARVLAATLAGAPNLQDPGLLTREQVRAAVWDALENPVAVRHGGRPRAAQAPLVLKLLVAREEHADGTVHFHVGVKLSQNMRFLAAKRTLRARYGLASHWSSSHTQLWSVARYLTCPTAKKPDADSSRLASSAPGVAFDVFEDAQEPFNARAWTKRREQKDTEADVHDEKRAFTKPDLNALVLAKNLCTKKRVLAYVQDHGTVSMQSFCAKHQRRLGEYLEDSQEWASARADAALEKRSDWELLCTAADMQCPEGNACVYAQAARDFFVAHAASFSASRLAVAIRSIIMAGPSKERRVPFLVGMTNSGKSTLIDPFDCLYGEAHVFHLPAESDTKGGALRDWVDPEIRLVYWDEFHPVEFVASKVISLTQFLKAFNGQVFSVQMNQRTNDGNKPFRWTRGAVFTAKEEGLWTPRGRVTEEDVSHIKSRCEVFHCSGQITRRPGGVCPCPICMARWIRDFALEHDANVALRPPPAPPVVGAVLGPPVAGAVQGLDALLHGASMAGPVADELKTQVAALGAVHVRELGHADWQALGAWGRLREMERRRLLAAATALG